VKLRAALKQQFKQLAQHFPEALLKSRDERRGSWTLDGTLPARKMWAFASRPEVQGLTIHSIDGRRRIARRPTLGWFCVWGVVAIQIEGRTQGKVDVEDRFVLVKAYDAKDARRRLRQEWSNYARPSNITLQPSNRASGYSDFQQLSRAQGYLKYVRQFLNDADA